MFIDSYDIVYVLGNLFMAFVIYKFMHIFYFECRFSQIIEYMAYACYFLLITLTHIFLKIPLIVMVVNIFLLLALTILYEGKAKKSILAVTIIYISLMSVETIFAFLTSVLHLNILKPFEYESEFGIIVIRIASFSMVLLAQGCKNVKNEYPLPNVYWFSLLTIPAGTVIMLFAIFTNASLSRIVLILCMVSALVINLFSFYLYDKISILLINQMEERIVQEQNRYYDYQVKAMKSTLDNMRILRHDLKNKLSPLYNLAISGKNEELAVQLAELTAICCEGKDYAKSGNSTIDSIINYKLQQAESQNIAVTTDILIPIELAIPTFDLAAILGNLIDNAIEATVKSKEHWVDIKIKYSKGRLIVEINNAYDGVVNVDKTGCFQTLKEDNVNHGMGLDSVQAVLKKYDGAMQIDHTEKIFKVKILLYL